MLDRLSRTDLLERYTVLRTTVRSRSALIARKSNARDGRESTAPQSTIVSIVYHFPPYFPQERNSLAFEQDGGYF